MSYDPVQYEALTSEGKGDPAFDLALANANAATLCRAVSYAWAEFLDSATVIDPILEELTTRFGFTDDDIQATAEGREPKGAEARSALGMISLLSFYAVKRVSGMVMCFPWAAEEIADAIMNKGVVGVIRGIQAVSTDAAESEAKRLFAAGQFEPSAIAQLEAQTPATPEPAGMFARGLPADIAIDEVAHFPMSNETTLHPSDLPDHPLLAHIPVWQASQPEFQALKESIRERGLDYPVLIDSERNVVDGRNRRNACAALGLEVPVQIVADDQIAEIIISALGNRRHVTKGAMAYLLAPLLRPAIECARARKLLALKTGQSPSSPQKTTGNVEDLADSLGFGRNLLFQALDLHKRFSENNDLRLQFEAKIIDGELGLGGALQAIAGKLATEGKEKHTRPASELISRAFTDLRNRWQHWGKIPEAQRDEVTAQVTAAASEWPAEVAAATAAAWRKAGLI